jgi:alkaline phosphatase D
VADRDDLDLVLHLGDYVYEYGNGDDRYGPPELAGKRDHVPATEMVTLPDYRQRQAQYKTDPDLQAAHAAHPWIVVFDDHEVTNDTFAEGAENHTPDAEGDFLARRAMAYQAYVEWMPIRLGDDSVPHQGVRFFRRFSFGPLADLSVIDTRQNRSEPAPGVEGALFGVDLATVNDPARVFMEPEQMQWLKDGIAAVNARWHLIGNQTVFTRVAVPRDLPGGDQLGPLGFTGPVFNTDQWDGYGDDQREVIAAMAASAADTVVLTGDIHSSWANDIPSDAGTYAPVGPANNSVGVEFVCASVTSDGFDEVLGGAPQAQAATTGIQVANPHVRYLDGIYHGYAV